MCDHEGKPCPGRSCKCVCDNCVLGDTEPIGYDDREYDDDQAQEAEQDRQQIMHDEMINDKLTQDGRWG